MNKILAASLLPILLVGVSHAAPASSPVVIELFTSEGCSSCPPADALLSKLQKAGAVEGAEVLVLGEHVDYWNHLGWADRFSSAALTQRQADYARRFSLDSSYTPQMVIDGHKELVGNDESGVRRQLALAAALPKPAQVKLAWAGANQLQIDVDAKDVSGQILLAITEDGLSTEVRNGENGGRTLRHSGVVRELREIGTLRGGQFASHEKLAAHSDWVNNNLRAVVFVQQAGHRDILGAASLAFSAR